MADVKDLFDRASLGANWESPTGSAGNGTLQMLYPTKNAVGMDPAKLNTRTTYGRWMADEFNALYQWAEIEVAAKDWDVSDYYTAYDDYAIYSLVLNMPTAAQHVTNKATIIITLTIWNSLSYDPLYFTAYLYDAAGNVVNGGGFGQGVDLPYEDYFDTPVFSAGAKLRAERIYDKLYVFLYSNQRNRWYKLPFEIDAVDLDVYTYTGIGFGLYALENADDAEATNFRAGDELTDFLGPTMLGIDIPDGVVETLAADGTTTAVDTKGPVYVTVSGGTWGGGTLQIERQNSAGEWKNIVDGSFTADFAKVLHFPSGAENSIRATLSGSTSPDLDVEVQAASQER